MGPRKLSSRTRQILTLCALARSTNSLNVKPELKDSCGITTRGIYDQPPHESRAGYNTALVFDFPAYIEKILEGKSKKRFTVLDIGTGSACFLSELKAVFGDKIEVFGISKEHYENDIEDDHHYIIGSVHPGDKNFILPHIPEQSFDLIVSFMGYFMPQQDLRFIYEILRILAPDGIARLHLSLRKNSESWAQNIPDLSITENKFGFPVVILRKRRPRLN